MNLPKITDLNVAGKKVLVRADLDVGDTLGEGEDTKLLTNKKTIDYLAEKGAKVVLIGHRGRPEGKVKESLSLAEVAKRLSELVGKKIEVVNDICGPESLRRIGNLNSGDIICLENLRFDSREESNDESFSTFFAENFDLFINEAFSSSAKEHASIVGIPLKMMSKAENTVGLGFHFVEEVEYLSKILENPKKPVVVLISGLKEDKLNYVEPFSEFADKILIAGRLPDLIDIRGIGHSELNSNFRNKIIELANENKVVVADLVQDKEDITMRSIEKFEEEIGKAGTIVVGGPMGRYEDEGHRQGTKRVFEAVVNNDNALKVAGGGDTEQAISLLGLKDKFNWVSVGGGAMLDFLANGTLPGIKALK